MSQCDYFDYSITHSNNNTITMLTIYSSKFCESCNKMMLLLTIFDIDFVKVDVGTIDISEFDFDSLFFFEYNGIYIHDFHTFSEFISEINKLNLTSEKITQDEIFIKIQRMIYDSDGDIEKMNTIFKLLSIGDIMNYHYKGYLLAHHIMCSRNDQLVKKLFVSHYDKLADLKTSAYILNTTCCKISTPKDQTLLHVAATNNHDLYLKLQKSKIICDTPDEFGFFAKDYSDNRNNISFLSNVNKLMFDKYGVSYDIDRIIIDEYSNDVLKSKILEYLSSVELTKPNSMHDRGVILSGQDFTHELVANLNEIFQLNLENKLYEIYAFTAEYAYGTNKKLDLHKDNSLITINWNLDISPDLKGTDVVFPSFDNIVTHKKDSLLIHHGKIDHQVTELVSGFRKNLVIWIK